MPDKKFEFLAVDEVQLAANSERGHNFTHKILESRGKREQEKQKNPQGHRAKGVPDLN